MDEPLAPEAAKRLIREILKSGRFTYSRHAKEELLADDLTTVDCENVLRGGVVRAGELEQGTWRYRVDTARITAQKHGWFGLMTSRGCPYPCDFCVVPETNDRRWRGNTPAEATPTGTAVAISATAITTSRASR